MGTRKNFVEICRQFGHSPSDIRQSCPRRTAKYHVNVSGPSEIRGLNLRRHNISATPPYIIGVGAQEFWKSLVARTFTWINFHTKDPPIIGATTQNSLGVPCITYFCTPARPVFFGTRWYLDWGILRLINLLLFLPWLNTQNFFYGNSKKRQGEVDIERTNFKRGEMLTLPIKVSKFFSFSCLKGELP